MTSNYSHESKYRLIYLALTGNTQLTSNIDKNLITSEKEQMLLGITIYSNLSFQDHINIMRKKASQKPKRPCIYRHTKKKNYNEINYYVLVWLMSISMNVSTPYTRGL